MLNQRAVKVFRQRRQRGATAVEFAMIAPLLFLMFFSMVEFGRASMALHAMEEAARSGCRIAIVGGATTADVLTEVNAILIANGIVGAVSTMDPDPLSNADQWEHITVTITTLYDDLSWLPVPAYLGNIQFTASCILPKEAHASPP